MAAIVDHPSDMDKDTEAIFESECFNCSQEDKHVEAEAFCVECEDNFCKSCLNDHNKIARFRTHEIQDKSAVKPGTTKGMWYLPTEKCLQHHGRLIEKYCASHDAVCCSVCYSLDHKSCPDVNCIPTVSSGTSTSKELLDTQTSTKLVLLQLDSVMKRRQEDLENVQKQRVEVWDRAVEITQNLIKSIEELSEKTTTDIMEKYTKMEDVINDDLKELQKSIDTLEDELKQMERSQNNEVKLFVQMKQNKQSVSDCRKLAQSLWPNIGQEYCTFEMNDAIVHYLECVTWLVRFKDSLEYDAIPKSEENIRCPYEFLTPDMTGMCHLDDGDLIIADRANSCLKKMDTSFRIKCRCALLGQPVDLCQTGSTEVAIAMLDDKKIQFVSVGQTMSLTRAFSTSGEGYCTSISFIEGNLYICRSQSSSSCVQVYDMNGNLLQSIQSERSTLPIFSRPVQTAINARLSNIYVADYDNGLIILDRFGKLVAKSTDTDLNGAYGLCVLPGDQLLVCSFSSHSVIQFDGQGKKVKTLLTQADGVKYPQALYLDPVTFSLIVGMKDSTKLKVFRLVRTFECET